MASKEGKLIRIPSTARMSRPARLVKMVAAICPDRDTLVSHQPNTASTGFWIPQCIADGHDPFTTSKEVEIKRPTYEERDGKKFKTGEEVEVELVTTPNMEQVASELKAYSGRGIEAALEMGWKYPEELGYAPFCDFLNCFIQNPKFETNVGSYCNRDQAAIMVLVTGNNMRSDVGTPTYITFGDDAPNFRRQLDNVNVQQGAGRQTGVGHDH
jgi:hypothetical protein